MINEMWIWKINTEYEQQNGICKMVFENTTYKDARWHLPVDMISNNETWIHRKYI